MKMKRVFAHAQCIVPYAAISCAQGASEELTKQPKHIIGQRQRRIELKVKYLGWD